MILVPNGGELIALRYLVNKDGATENLVYRLFVNNITPAETDTAASYTIASGGGYADKSLTGSSWTLTPGAPSNAAYAEQEWVFSGPLAGNATIYGYLAIRQTSLDLVLAERLTTPRQPVNPNDALRITPIITAD